MSIPISNASSRLLTETSGTLPDVSGALLDYFQAMTFVRVGKVVDEFIVTETPTDIDFQGVIQPFGARQLAMKPEGQRAWKWWMLHAQPGITLEPDEVVSYQGTQYRVRSQNDYGLYGYVSYELTEDYSGAGP